MNEILKDIDYAIEKLPTQSEIKKSLDVFLKVQQRH